MKVTLTLEQVKQAVANFCNDNNWFSATILPEHVSEVIRQDPDEAWVEGFTVDLDVALEEKN